MYEQENIKEIENTARIAISCIAVQKWWRHLRLQRKRAEDERIRKRVILENKAATTIVSCY